MECYTGDTKREIANYLLSHNEIIDLMTYCVNFRQDEYPFYKILANDHVVIGNLNSNYAYHFLKDLSSNGVFDNQDDYLSYYWRNEEVFNLDFLGEIGLNIERYYSHKRALQHGIELGIIDENGIEIDKPSDLQQQLASATNTINRQAEKITELEAQLASATDNTKRQDKEITELKEQLASIKAGKDTQKDTPADNEPKYTTTAITALNHVIREFWQDWTQGTTPPKQAHIVKWITDNYPSINRTTATNIDRIARHESLK